MIQCERVFSSISVWSNRSFRRYTARTCFECKLRWRQRHNRTVPDFVDRKYSPGCSPTILQGIRNQWVFGWHLLGWWRLGRETTATCALERTIRQFFVVEHGSIPDEVVSHNAFSGRVLWYICEERAQLFLWTRVECSSDDPEEAGRMMLLKNWNLAKWRTIQKELLKLHVDAAIG